MLCVLLLSGSIHSMAQNNPFVDEKKLHFGFFLGLDLLSYNIEPAGGYTPRVMSVGHGFQVGFITDLRLHEYVNLRFNPALHFGERTISYDKKQEISQSLLTIPISLPVYIKWSAPRLYNFRPYVLVGGGVEFECYRDKEKFVLHQPFDAFVSAGFGCDLYFRWFKLCPEIKYQIGFLDAHVPINEAEKHKWEIGADNYFYSNAISRMTHQKISIVFNFE